MEKNGQTAFVLIAALSFSAATTTVQTHHTNTTTTTERNVMQQQQYYSKLQLVLRSQGGRQELEIGVAYKIGQKYPNHNIFETQGQKDRSRDGQKS